MLKDFDLGGFRIGTGVTGTTPLPPDETALAPYLDPPSTGVFPRHAPDPDVPGCACSLWHRVRFLVPTRPRRSSWRKPRRLVAIWACAWTIFSVL